MLEVGRNIIIKMNQDLILIEMLEHLEKGSPLDYLESLTNKYETYLGNKELIELIDNYLEGRSSDRNILIEKIKSNITLKDYGRV